MVSLKNLVYFDDDTPVVTPVPIAARKIGRST
jgi:hypothetical protein